MKMDIRLLAENHAIMGTVQRKPGTLITTVTIFAVFTSSLNIRGVILTL